MGQVTWLKCPGHCVLTISVVYRLLQVKMDHRGLFNRPDNLINQGTAIILLHQAKFQVHSYTVYSLDTIHSYMTVKNYIIHFFFWSNPHTVCDILKYILSIYGAFKDIQPNSKLNYFDADFQFWYIAFIEHFFKNLFSFYNYLPKFFIRWDNSYIIIEVWSKATFLYFPRVLHLSDWDPTGNQVFLVKIWFEICL